MTETLADAPDGVDEEVVAAARAVTDAVANHDADAATAIGVDLERVRAGFVRIQSVEAAGTGVRVRQRLHPPSSTASRPARSSQTPVGGEGADGKW